MLKKKNKYHVAIVGATGLVGRTFIQVLEEVDFPIDKLTLLASIKSEDKEITAFGKKHKVKVLDQNSFKDVDIASSVFCNLS